MPDLFLPRTEDEADGEVRHTLNPKLVFGSILFFGIFTLGYGMMKIWSDIRAPGLAQDRARQSAENLAALNVPAVPTEAEMRARDTDGDGLNDWDELNRFGTSPYLKDSDADGYPDKTEVDSGNDPNCPRGQNCRIGSAAPAPPAGGLFSDLNPDAALDAAPSPPPDLASLTPQQVRDLLLQTGEVTKEQLDQIDDATLMQMYRETLSQQQPQQP